MMSKEVICLAIVNVRIDERLIHGQVATMWTNNLKTTRIMVINDEVASDPIQKSALKLSTPAGIKLSVLSVEKAAINIQANKYEGQRVFVLLKNPEDCLRLVKLGVEIKELNVGNMSHRQGGYHVKKSVSVSDENIKSFKELDEKGIKIIAQMVPSEQPVSFMSLLSNL